ncbi:MAG: calcium/sodium antiporter [Lachnospiraceae bacterium]
MELILQVIFLVLGFVMLIKGADWFVEGASKIAERLGIPQIIIGLTIVAMGTSAPEAAISISAALKGSAEITIGNVLGSNIMNVLLILGITSIIIPLTLQKNTLKIEIPFVIGISILLPLLGLMDGVIDVVDGVILFFAFFLFLGYLFRSVKKGEHQVEEIEDCTESDTPLKLSLYIIAGALFIIIGSDVTVDAATMIAKMFGWSERLIGLTIVAFGTSLPELITSVMAGIKGKADIAIGNIVGSNIFNILFVVGVTSLITPVQYSAGFYVDSVVTILAAVLLLVCVIKNQKLTRIGGCVMLTAYATYFVYLLS